MNMEQHTEEDTYLALRRIPLQDIEKRLSGRFGFIQRNEEAKRFNERLAARRKSAWGRFLTRKEEKRVIFHDADIFRTIIHTIDGTGWELEAIQGEINKRLEKEEIEEAIKRRKRRIGVGTVMVLTCFAMTAMTLAGAPALVHTGLGLFFEIMSLSWVFQRYGI
jgi:hypothetical protein